jgi:hypothetical protein
MHSAQVWRPACMRYLWDPLHSRGPQLGTGLEVQKR